MSFCPNCGKELRENTVFCGNCGQKIGEANPPKTNTNVTKIKGTFDLKELFSKAKNYLSTCRINYDSLFFKFAIAIFFALGAGEELYGILRFFWPTISSWSIYADVIVQYGLAIVLFGLFALFGFFKKSKKTKPTKKSNTVYILWLISILLSVLLCIADINLYKYVLFPALVKSGIKLLLLVSTVLLLHKNRPHYPVSLVISFITYVLSNTSFFSIKLKFLLHSMQPDYKDILTIFNINVILLTVLVFLARFLFSEKISKWIIALLGTAVMIGIGIDNFSGFSLYSLIYFAEDILFCVAVLLFAFSCTRNLLQECTSDEDAEEIPQKKMKPLLIGIVSAVTTAVLTAALLLTSALVAATQINEAVSEYKYDIIYDTIQLEEEWRQISADINKYSCTEFASPYIKDYNTYITIKENFSDMRNISMCYVAYNKGPSSFTDDYAEMFLSITVDESWEDNSLLSRYYEKYLAMKPRSENVTVRATVDVNRKTISFTATNKNVLPISNCTVKCDFTIGFYEGGGYYSDTEYGRGSKTITLSKIPGNDTVTETIDFEPDDYYDSYGSYVMAFLMDSSVKITSIE